MKSNSTWEPGYTITPSTAKRLMAIEAICRQFDYERLPLAMESELRRQARLRSTHYSTRIEGNRLTLAEAEIAVDQPDAKFPGRDRDVREINNYWSALAKVEEWAAAKRPVTGDLLRRLHALVEYGKRAKPTPYRDGQNVIKDSTSGAIVYMPPEAKDVPGLMVELISWLGHDKTSCVPIPVVAGLAHYQFVTIHPYYDGNGRTARLLASYLLQRDGYGLHGCLAVEEQHALDLPRYYQALAIHPHHNYYFGRAEADLTGWVDYYVEAVLDAAQMVLSEASRIDEKKSNIKVPKVLRRLDPRARKILSLFAKQERLTAKDIAKELGLSERMARVLAAKWVNEGLLELENMSRRNRAYSLARKYRGHLM